MDFKALLPIIIHYFVLQAEEQITKEKSGKTKFAHVVQGIEDFVNKIGFEGILDYDFIGKLIEEKVVELINKI